MSPGCPPSTRTRLPPGFRTLQARRNAHGTPEGSPYSAIAIRVGATVGGYGGYQAVMWDAAAGVFIGASESRKDGQAAGY